MNKIDDEVLKKYFYYGIDNKKGLEDGLIFYSSRQMHRKDSLDMAYKKWNENKDNLDGLRKMNIDDLVDSSIGVFLQYYKFILLPDNPSNYKPEITEEKIKYIRGEIAKRIEELEKDKALTIYPIGIYYTREQESIYNETTWLASLEKF